MKHLSYVLAFALALTLNFNKMNAQSAYDYIPSQEPTEQKVAIRTPYGEIVVKLYNETPLHRDNFIKLVKTQMLDSTLFHRVIKNFMIQGGDPQSKRAQAGEVLGGGDLGYTVPAEIIPGLLHKKGALCAARMGDQVNPQRESSASQFYIVQGRVYTPEEINLIRTRYGMPISPDQEAVYTTVGGTPHLDGAYTVFGEVVSGLEVIDLISAQETDANDRPLQDIPMTVTLL
ncbi:MAG: peptidylprolyl isomerase [Bacteroidales bacterium]|nr:peptidylprolyl isomerase [Bacteroidales bacterium]